MQNDLTKQQTTMIQGIAVLFMLYHHFFLNPSAVPGIAYGNMELTMHAAWFGKICVGLFCFVSGYGLYFSGTKLPHDHVFDLLGKAYLQSLHRLLRLFIKLWIVIILFKGFDFLFLQETLLLAEFLGNLTTISISYNGSWWFIRQYVVMLLLLPFLDLFFTRFSITTEKKKQWLILSTLFLISILSVSYGYFHSPETRYLTIQVKNFLPPVFTLTFACGFFCARFHLFARIHTRLFSHSPLVLYLSSGCALILSILIRVLFTHDAAFATLDFILVPLFIFGLVELSKFMKCCSRIFLFFGSISTYLWLIHLLIYDHTVDAFAGWFSPYGGMPSTLFYLLELFLSTVIAYLLTRITAHLPKFLR